MAKRFLQNNGKPSVITVATQKWVQYYDKKGIFHKIKVVMKRDGDDDPDVDKFRVPDDEKCLIYEENGVFKGKYPKPIDSSFMVNSFPHMLNIHVGRDKYNERVYNFRVGDIVQIDCDEYPADFDYLFKNFSLLDEVDEKGGMIKENIYTNPPRKEKIDYSQMPTPDMQEIPYDSREIRRTSSVDQRVWKPEIANGKPILDDNGNIKGKFNFPVIKKDDETKFGPE